jgi:hypothetical protein
MSNEAGRKEYEAMENPMIELPMKIFMWAGWALLLGWIGTFWL